MRGGRKEKDRIDALRPLFFLFFPLCAQNRNRTCTVLLPLDFESSASTNSAIWAFDSPVVIPTHH